MRKIVQGFFGLVTLALVAGGIWRIIPMVEDAQAINVTTCGQAINVAGATYVLQNDLNCSGTALSISAANITLDLNGHTITYDKDQSGIANKSFENGVGTVPDDWDLSGCSGCQRTSTSTEAGSGSWLLSWTNNGVVGDSIVSALTTMPANRQCVVSFIWPRPNNEFDCGNSSGINRPIFHYCVVDNANNIVGQGYTIATAFNEQYGFTTTAATQYRLRFRLTRAPGCANQYGFPLAIDELNMSTGTATYPTGAVYGVTGTIASTGAHVQNGFITQGAGGGEYNVGIRVPANGWVIDGVTIHTTGNIAMGIASPTGLTSSEVRNCTITTDSPIVHVRNKLEACIQYPQCSGIYVHNNTLTTGPSLAGVVISGNSGLVNDGSRVSTNTITDTCPITNHHAIVIYQTGGARVDNNVINCTYGQGGVLVSADTDMISTEVDHNTITMSGIQPNVEYGWLDFDAIRLNQYGHVSTGYNVHDNTITITGRDDPFYALPSLPSLDTFSTDCSITPMPTNGCIAINGILDASHGTNNIIQNNTITVTIDAGAKCVGSAITFGNSSTVSGTTFLNNTLRSNNIVVTLCDYAPQAHWEVIRGNVLHKTTPVVNDFRTIINQRVSYPINTVRFVGNTLENGASLNSPRIFTNQPWDYTIENPLTVVVKTPAGTPISGTAVVVTDSTSAVVASGTTDVTGKFSADILYQSLSGPAFNTSVINTITKRSHLVSVAGACPAQRVVIDRPRQITFVSGVYTLPGQNLASDAVYFSVSAPSPVATGSEFWVNCRVGGDYDGGGAFVRSLRGEILYDSTKVVPVQWDASTSSLDSILVVGGVSYHTINPPVPVTDSGSFTDGARPIVTSFAGGTYNKSVKLIQWTNAAADPESPPTDVSGFNNGVGGITNGKTIGRMRFRAISAGTAKFAWTCDTADNGPYTAGGITGPRAWLQDQFLGGHKMGPAHWSTDTPGAITIAGANFDPCTKWSSHPNCSEYATAFGSNSILFSQAKMQFTAIGDSIVGGQAAVVYPSQFTFTNITGVRSGWSATAGSSSASVTCPGSKVILINFCRTAGMLEPLTDQTILFEINFTVSAAGFYTVAHPCVYDATEKTYLLVGTRAAPLRLTWLSASAAQRYDYAQDGNVQVNQ